ncbi:MAG TPA: Lrp/AsnC family transcriptional regulator [Desulfomonilia bacterium]
MATLHTMKELDKIDMDILRLAQGDLPVCKEPFALWAAELGISQEELINRLKMFKENGIIRDFKAILRHQKAGILANAIVTWAVKEERVEEAGKELSGYEAITHCYERPDFGAYNIFTMIHARTKKELQDLINMISEETGLRDYKIFWSKREFKKSSMQYF